MQISRNMYLIRFYPRRLLLQQDWLTNVRFSCPMQSVWHSLPPLWWIPSEPAKSVVRSWWKLFVSTLDLRPAGIIKMLGLRRPIYKQTSAYGHFGRNDLDLPWEKLDKVDNLRRYING